MSKRHLQVAKGDWFPAYVVWEITLKCDQPCRHCGSRAGAARETELTTAEALDVVKQLAAMRAGEVVLIGGEAYLHEGFLEIVRALKKAGIQVSMTTGGRGITAKLARDMKAAGIYSVSVSVDGLERAHDLIRKVRGSFRSAMEAIGHLRAAKIVTASNVNVNRANQGDLEALYELLRDKGIQGWQVQITSALGRAADRPDMLLQPYDLLQVLPRIAKLKERAFADGITVMPGNNLGYFGPEEALLRSPVKGDREHFQGCQAGKLVMGIESDGAVKGCPSLQTHAYVGGNLREKEAAGDLGHVAGGGVRAGADGGRSLGGSAARARSRRCVWAGAPSRRTRCSGGRATTPIATTAPGRWRRRASGRGSSRGSRPRGCRSTTGCSRSWRRAWTRRSRRRRGRRRSWCGCHGSRSEFRILAERSFT